MTTSAPNRQSDFVEVIIPIPLEGPFTYHIPAHISAPITVGSRVIVPFGSRKFYTGIVRAFVPAAPVGVEAKDIINVLDDAPIVRHPQLKLWEWIGKYYLCSIGDVYKAAVPSGLKIEIETFLEVNPDFEPEEASLPSEREAVVLQLLGTKGKMTPAQIARQTGFHSITSLLQKMVDKGSIFLCESVSDRYRNKTLKLVRVAIERFSADALAAAFAAVKGAKRQEQMFQTLLHMSHFTLRGAEQVEVQQSELIEATKGTTATLKALEDKGLVERYTKVISRFSPLGLTPAPLPTLSEAQQKAFTEINRAWAEKQVTLLHGVTASGKTEIYIHLIDCVLKQVRQALFLVPEIALTTQLTTRLQRVFGDKVIIYHSKFTDNERVEIWRKLLTSGEECVVIGARSAIFLPFARLGLVIVDEEHEPSYKQVDPAPRYNARDAAIMLAGMHGAKVLLGSATPSIETYYKATSGKYGLATLSERFAGAKLPKVEIVDMAAEAKKKAVNGAFAHSTIASIRGAIRDGRQAIIFNNRRGYAPIARCTKCEFIPKCLYCDVSLTWHKSERSLVCHYCGTRYPMPNVCPNCKEPALRIVGYGTERVEDDVASVFPEAKSLRMDLDTTRSRNAYEHIISEFSAHKADILIGTQMVTKGLDFSEVEIVTVLDADRIINYPDFRSSERAFNMLSQVAGRAGRSSQFDGRVLIQTRTPEHPVIKFVKNLDYSGFYEHELAERRAYAYPPFSRVIIITMKHRDEAALETIVGAYATRLRELFGTRISGPSEPTVARISELHIRKVMLRVELEASMVKVKEILRAEHAALRNHPIFAAPGTPSISSLIVQYDVDPY